MPDSNAIVVRDVMKQLKLQQRFGAARIYLRIAAHGFDSDPTAPNVHLGKAKRVQMLYVYRVSLSCFKHPMYEETRNMSDILCLSNTVCHWGYLPYGRGGRYRRFCSIHVLNRFSRASGQPIYISSYFAWSRCDGSLHKAH